MLRSIFTAMTAAVFSLIVAFAASAEDAAIPDMVQGDESAPVTLIEYASYTCPHCANFHTNVYHELKKNYIDTGKVKFVFREVYFDRFGLWASMIARCSGPERFFGVTDLMFKGQSTWARANSPAEIVDELRKIGRLAGMTEESLDTCLQDSDQAQALVSWYQANAEKDQIESTPSLIINGQKYSNMNYADLSAIIEEKLAE